MVKTFVAPISNTLASTEKILEEHFGVSNLSDSLQRYIDCLKPDLWVLIEFPYVDKLYRDAYYHYFSSKHASYNRDTIRLSFFDHEISTEDFREFDKYEHLQKYFCGFLVIRPIRRCVGRNFISPRAFRKNNINVRIVETFATINGVKLHVKGFPHSSQDAEAMTCAETTVWSLMEYFGMKYSEYCTVLPSDIRRLLNGNSPERQLPSNGLVVDSISFLIKNFGFGSKKYSIGKTKAEIDDFYQSLYCYVESGIPIVLCLMNEIVGHATVCNGRSSIPDEVILNLKPIKIGNNFIYDINSAKRKLVVIDDNFPPYQLAYAETPTSYYNSQDWQGAKITFFVVPLHKKIYLEPLQAKEFLCAFFASNLIELPANCKTFVRLFLTSSRSLKFNIYKNNTLSQDLKEYILMLELPKFVWVAEISDEEIVLQKMANGLVLFDATEIDHSFLKPLFFAAFNGKILAKKADSAWKLYTADFTLRAFSSFSDNLTPFV